MNLELLPTVSQEATQAISDLIEELRAVALKEGRENLVDPARAAVDIPIIARAIAAMLLDPPHPTINHRALINSMLDMYLRKTEMPLTALLALNQQAYKQGFAEVLREWHVQNNSQGMACPE